MPLVKLIEYISQVSYANRVGSLMYVIACTRANLVRAISVVTRFMSHPGKEH